MKIKKVYALVIYDIVNDRRRNRFVHFLNGYGIRVQKSCFEVVLDEKTYRAMISRIPDYAEEEDNIRVYRFEDRGQVLIYGREALPCEEDIIVV